MSDRIKHPTQVYSFGDFSQRTPNQQPPGDRLDAQFSDHAQVLNEVIVALNNDEARLVRKDDLAPELIDSLTRDVLLRTGMDAQAAAGAAMTSIHSAATALEAAIQSEASAVKASADAEVVRQGQGSVLSALEQLGAVASGHAITLQNAKQTVDNSANDAAKASAIAQDYAVLSQAWAENMPDTIPPNILATMDITGSHWSSRWWANQADISSGVSEDWANQAQDAADAANAALDAFTDLYLGPHPANPTLDNDGNPLQVGAVYYNTSDGNMYVWSGTQWTVSSSAKGWVPEAPIDTHTYVRGNASWLLSAGGIGEAPNDGNAYARKSVAWSQLNSNDVIFDTGPATVTGAVNLKASQIALTAETNARIAGDQANAASINGLKASNIANDSSVAGVTVKDALNTNLGAINANAAAVALKADAAATTSALALKANIASPVFTGDPQAPTPAPGDNDTSIPTTAWVNTAVGAALALKPSVIVSAAAPGTPIDNAMWWESDTGYLFLRYNDGNSAQWVQLNGIPTALQANYVAKAGDTMTGGLTVAPGSGGAQIIVNKPASGNAAQLQGQMAGKIRWNVTLGNGAAESGSNAGSDFVISRFDDSGTIIDGPLSINRATGSIISAPPTGIYGLTVQPPVGGASLLLNKSAGNYPVTISSQTAGKARWQMVMGSGDETGSGNGGGDFYLQNYNDAGALLLNALTIARSSGQATFGTTMRASGFNCRTGVSGGFGGSNFNFNWTTTAVQVWIDNSNLGNMTYTSDYRIKKDVAPLTPMWETVKALRPISYTHKDYTPPTAVLKEDGSPADPMFTNDDTERWGFIAHELQETLTESAATGFKDSPDHIQSPNPWTLLAAVTKALQEAMQRIENLEARMV